MKQYIDMVEKVLEDGAWKSPVRKVGNKWEPVDGGIRTKAVPNLFFSHEMRDGFPLLTTKKMAWKAIRVELEGFIKGITDKQWFQDRNCKIWDEWANPEAVEEYTRVKDAAGQSPQSRKEVQKQLKDLGPIYGANWRNFDGWYKPTPQIQHTKPPTEQIFCEQGFSGNKMVGRQFSSNNYGDFFVVKGYYKGNQQRFDIQFTTTNYVQTCRTKQNILDGEVFDPWYPSVCGVACMGNLSCKNDPMFKQLRVMWESMISRCYNKNDRCYNIYGGKGVYVDNRWLTLSNFIQDVRTLEHWEQKVNEWDRWSLDKDYFQKGYYSKDTCLFLNKTQQVQYSSRFNNDNVNQHLYRNGCDQLKNIVETLRTNPTDRRMVCSAWNPNQIHMMALPPCHYAWNVTVIDNKVNLFWAQRSADLMLGVPFNIASYGLLLSLLARDAGLEVGNLSACFVDCHIYENQLDGAYEQITRKPQALPNLVIDNNVQNLVAPDEFDIFNWSWDQTRVKDYWPLDKIDFGKVAV